MNYKYDFVPNWNNKQYESRRTIQNSKIFEAFCNKTKRSVIIKKLQKEHEIQKYIDREKQIVSYLTELSKEEIKNQNVVEFYEIFEENDFTFIVMEKCDGDLDQCLKDLHRSPKINSDLLNIQGLEILRQIVQGYQYLLNRFGDNFQHRDLKPQNIFHKDGFYKIADFGFCKLVDFDNPTKTIGSQQYMAPEIQRGEKYNNQCDIFSLGRILYWIVTNSDKIQVDLADIQNEYIRTLVRQMIETDISKRLTWQKLIKQDFMNKDHLQLLSIGCIDQRCFSNLIPVASILDNNSFDTQGVSSTFVHTQQINNNIKKYSQLNRCFADAFKIIQPSSIITRYLFTLWIKLLDLEIRNLMKQQKQKIDNNNQTNNNEIIKAINDMIEKISVQQLIRIKNEEDHSIEFMEIDELCMELKKSSDIFPDKFKIIIKDQNLKSLEQYQQ